MKLWLAFALALPLAVPYNLSSQTAEAQAHTSAQQSNAATDAGQHISEDADRPVLKHQSAPMQQYGVPDNPDDVTYEQRLESSKPEVAPGLALPNAGHVWALDKFDGQPELVQLKYTVPGVDSHGVENTVKGSLAPFIYKPKGTWELQNEAAATRLHDATPSIFYFDPSLNIDAADAASSLGDYSIVRLQVREGKRIIATTAFRQFTGKAKRSENEITAQIENVGAIGWKKIAPAQPLSPGEYALVRLPKQANLIGAMVYDFAIDPKAPQNKDAVLPDSAKEE